MVTGNYDPIFLGTPEFWTYKSAAFRLLNEKLADPVQRTDPATLWTVAQFLLMEVRSTIPYSPLARVLVYGTSIESPYSFSEGFNG